MRWLIRFLITTLVLIPFIWHVVTTKSSNPDALSENSGILSTTESWAYDYRLKARMPKTSDDDIVIIDIDENSINQIGQWPWKRDVLANLVDILYEYYNIEVLGFDIAFAEADRSDDLELLTELSQNKLLSPEFDVEIALQRRDRDRRFAQSFENRKVILGAVFDGADVTNRPIIGSLGEPIIEKLSGQDNLQFLELDTYTGNLDVLQKSAWGSGNFHPITLDADGKIRRTPLLIAHNNSVYESLAFAMVRAKLDAEDVQFVFATDKLQDLTALSLNGIEFPVGEYTTVLIPYRGEGKTFKYISAVDILNKKFPKEEFTASIGLVGTTAAGLNDQRVTPVSENYPGVEVHANIISGLLTDSIKQYPPEQDAMQLAMLLVGGILLTLILPLLPVLLKVIFAFLLAVAAYLLNMKLWSTGLVVPISPTIIFIFTAFVAHLIYGSFVESNRKRQLTRLFGQYVPPKLVEEMETDLEKYSMDPRDQELTVMFADIQGFTKMSEGLEVEQVTEILNEFLTLMTEVIQDKRGTIDKYMGDAIMAFWGAPVNDEQHARHAFEAASEMLVKMRELNISLANRALPQINVRVGLNTGLMSVGDMGSEFRRAYTVIGDEVNLAARIESLTRVYDVGMIIGENTRKQLTDVLCLELDKVLVKGKEKAVIIYHPLGLISEMTENQGKMLAKNKEAIEAYREQNWGLAEALFSDLASTYPEHKTFSVYLKRINDFKLDPPAFDWDGSFRYLNK